MSHPEGICLPGDIPGEVHTGPQFVKVAKLLHFGSGNYFEHNFNMIIYDFVWRSSNTMLKT